MSSCIYTHSTDAEVSLRSTLEVQQKQQKTKPADRDNKRQRDKETKRQSHVFFLQSIKSPLPNHPILIEPCS